MQSFVQIVGVVGFLGLCVLVLCGCAWEVYRMIVPAPVPVEKPSMTHVFIDHHPRFAPKPVLQSLPYPVTVRRNDVETTFETRRAHALVGTDEGDAILYAEEAARLRRRKLGL